MSVLVLAVLSTSACGATQNPRRPKEPSPWTLSVQPAQEPAQGGPRAEADDARAAAAGSAASVRQDPAPSKSSAAQGADPALAIATVAGQPIDARELFAQWLHHSSAELYDEIDQLVMERLIELEAARNGIAVDPEDVDLAYERAVASITRELERRRPGTALDEYVERSLGLDPETYRARLRRGARRALLGERVFRMHLLTNEHAWARMIVVPDREQADTIRRELDRGGDFASLARTHSLDGDEEQRGKPVPVLKSEAPMARLVFQTAVGEIAGPVQEQGAYLLLRVEERHEPLAGAWPEVREAVERSLSELPPQDLEITQWKGAMLRRYEVDLSPFRHLAGEPAEER